MKYSKTKGLFAVSAGIILLAGCAAILRIEDVPDPLNNSSTDGSVADVSPDPRSDGGMAPRCPSGTLPLRIATASLAAPAPREINTQGITILKAINADIILMQDYSVKQNYVTLDAFMAREFEGYSTYWNKSIRPTGVITRYPINDSVDDAGIARGEIVIRQVGDAGTIIYSSTWIKIRLAMGKSKPRFLFVFSVMLSEESEEVRSMNAQKIMSKVTEVVNETDLAIVGGNFNTGGGYAPAGNYEGCATYFTARFFADQATNLPVNAFSNPATDVGEDERSRLQLDRLFPSLTLHSLDGGQNFEIPVVHQGKRFATGMVFDPRDRTQAERHEMGISEDACTYKNVGHLPVVRDFCIPMPE